MRFLVISDIHANLAAFEAVLADAEGEWDQIWCLGDVVGYGPDPNECAALLQSQDHVTLTGNHDWAVLGKLNINSFNPEARQAIEWTRAALSKETADYLAEQPAQRTSPPFILAHGSPRQPVWEYILDAGTAAVNFAQLPAETPYCLVGHTHTPVVFLERGDGPVEMVPPRYGEPFELAENRLIINPGSVGQPRDSDPRAAYALLDIEALTWEHRRVPYPIAVTQERMRQHGLPHRLVTRLEYGW